MAMSGLVHGKVEHDGQMIRADASTDKARMDTHTRRDQGVIDRDLRQWQPGGPGRLDAASQSRIAKTCVAQELLECW